MDQVVKEISFLREQGQREYAHSEDNAFANFDRVARDLDLTRKQVLWVYARKHMDGIVAAINGHTSQREPVEGRINDLIVYMILLRGMFEDERTMLGNPNTPQMTPSTRSPYNV